MTNKSYVNKEKTLKCVVHRYEVQTTNTLFFPFSGFLCPKYPRTPIDQQNNFVVVVYIVHVFKVLNSVLFKKN